MKQLAALPLLLTLLLGVTTAAYAHKIRIFAWEEGGDIVTESKFSGGRAARNVAISVIDSATGKELLNGTTDSDGMFRFPVPRTTGTELEITVDSGDGHKGSWKHLLEAGAVGASPVSPAPAPENSSTTTSFPTSGERQAIDTEQLTSLIEEVLERKLGPIRKSLAENAEKGPSLQDIISGIGYIFGLAGIASYMRFRKKTIS